MRKPKLSSKQQPKPMLEPKQQQPKPMPKRMR
jgi:hypothetical protein